MTWKHVLWIGGFVALIWFFNSCSCPLAFNNGSCEWSQTVLGGSH